MYKTILVGILGILLVLELTGCTHNEIIYTSSINATFNDNEWSFDYYMKENGFEPPYFISTFSNDLTIFVNGENCTVIFKSNNHTIIEP